MVLIYVCALDLTHCDEMICQQRSIVITHSSDFTQALIGIEEEFFTQILKFLRFLCKHVFERLVFVL